MLKAALTLLSLLATPAMAQQFSADIVDLQPNGMQRTLGESGKLYVSGTKVRIDRADASGTRFLVDTDKAISYVVAPTERIYMDAKQSSILTELFVPVDPAAPCTTWQTMAKVAGDAAEDGSGQWQCELAGATEEIDGRSTVKVTMTSPRGIKRTGWIDSALKFLVKTETADGSVLALRHIEAAPQPANLFELPGGLRKYDPAQLIARIKESDVWVEPPK